MCLRIENATKDDFKIGVRICFEVRFPEYFRELYKADTDFNVVIFYDVANKDDIERYELIKAHLKTRDVENINIINDIRKKYDPLVDLVSPHITLVFPFESDLSNEELNLYIKECLSDIHPFKIELEGFSKQKDIYGNYLFLLENYLPLSCLIKLLMM